MSLHETALALVAPGKGILASLEHKSVETPRHAATAAPSSARGALLVLCSGVLVGALLAWWLASGASPAAAASRTARAAGSDVARMAEAGSASVTHSTAAWPAPSTAMT